MELTSVRSTTTNLEFYEAYFAPMRDKKITLLEIGVFGGASLRTWQEYFPRAKIIGADIDPRAKKFERERIRVKILDQSNIDHLTSLAISCGPFDIIIEDGSHMWEHQITSLRTLFPFLKDDGIYIVEDLQTNYGSLAKQYKGVATYSAGISRSLWLYLPRRRRSNSNRRRRGRIPLHLRSRHSVYDVLSQSVFKQEAPTSRPGGKPGV